MLSDPLVWLGALILMALVHHRELYHALVRLVSSRRAQLEHKEPDDD